MSSITISKLKTNPADAIRKAEDLPVAIKKRNKIAAYLLGKDLYEKLVSFIENHIDITAVKNTDFSKGKNFEEVAEELGI